jgi:hypothetical protein
VFCWLSGFLEAWGAKAKKPHIVQKQVVFSLAAEGGKAKQTFVSGESVVPWRPRPQKNHLAKNSLRDPFGASEV